MIIDRNSPIPQYFQLQTWLQEQIQQGIFKTNEKIPTEEEFVKITGLARATIRQALQNLVNLGFLSRKKGVGTFVTRPETEEKKNTTIGIIIPDIRSGYAPELARGAEDVAAENKRSLILCNTDDLHVKAEFHADRLIENSVGGVIFVPTASSDKNNRKIINKLSASNIPVVLADRTIPGLDIDYVTTNNFDGAFKITRHLIKKNHKKIAFLYSSISSTERLRFDGYKKALKENKIPLDKSIIIAHDGPFIDKHFMKYALSLLKKRDKITAVFAGHDRIALQFYSAANKLNLSIPEDISIVGYDDLNFTTVPLTTMHQPIYEMGQESMKLLLARLNGSSAKPRKIVFESHLVERSSVKLI
jgi:DNA-binding LacI/PurR family transcriptional regulator